MIAVDWGTSNLRVFRLDATGQTLDSRRSMQGVLVSTGRFEDVLTQAVEGWSDRLIVMAGMIGSRQGWQEVPYVACPSGLTRLAEGMQKLRSAALPDREIWIVPGLSILDGDTHEVMRGEETQICGMLADMKTGIHSVCLVGTHSKFVVVEQGRIVHFSTTMTGEMFALLCEHSILGRLMQGHEYRPDAFIRGVDDSRKNGSLLRHLFAVRTHGLFKTLQPEALRSYLSGLLIGHELTDLNPAAGTVHLVASPSLVEPYSVAFARRGYTVEPHQDNVAAIGLHALAGTRGLRG